MKCKTSFLNYLIPTNLTEKIFEFGIIDSGVFDHQLIFCTRNVKRIKLNKHNNLLLRSLRHYTAICSRTFAKSQFFNS